MHPALHPTTHTAEEGTPHGSSGMDRAFAEDHGGSSGGGGARDEIWGAMAKINHGWTRLQVKAKGQI